jgi:hypothetical protein
MYTANPADGMGKVAAILKYLFATFAHALPDRHG